MPELPEVETMVRGIRSHVAGQTIQSIRACRCACRPIDIRPSLSTIAKRVRGVTITVVRRIAKRVVMDLASGDHLVVEPRMTGLMVLRDPPDKDHLRVEWRLAATKATVACGDSHSAETAPASLWFWDRRGLGTLRLFDDHQFAQALGADHLGPDALLMDEDDWIDRCRRTDRAIKVALLDQKFVAGIGNLYASEILHVARISPLLPASRITRRRVRRMIEAARLVLETAIKYEGSTLGDGTYRNALNDKGRYQNEHRVYMKAGERCTTCQRGSIQKIVQQQRSTFYCPVCQK